MAREAYTPNAVTAVPSAFPAGSKLVLSPHEPTLILFAHPQCPCTRATLRELDHVLGAVGEKVDVTIVFTLPPGVPAGWEKGVLWDEAAAMPGIHMMRDVDGDEARRFHVLGSGHVLLFQTSGQLLFSGGITGSRGHEGDNPGEDAVVALIDHGYSDISRTPVFGCSLL